MESYDIIVIGGGIVGLSAAIAMSKHNFTVSLIDAGGLTATIPDTPDVRVYAINQSSEALFRELEVWDLLEQKRLSPYAHMHIWDAASNATIDFDARMIAKDKLGTIVEESVLKVALLQKARESGIHLLSENKVSGVSLINQTMHLQCGENTWKSKLLMVADGANSHTRDLLGVSINQWSYHQTALVANVETQHSHEKTAYQVFNPSGPLAFLPLANQNQCSIVWSLPPARAESLMAMGEEEFCKHLQEAFAKKLGNVNLLGKRHSFPLTMRHAKRYTGDYWLLLGDAAHTIHPLAGLGLNVGLADVQNFSRLFEDKKNLHSRKLLGSYQRQRKYEVWQIIAAMQTLKGIFANPLLTGIRSVGLNCINQLDFVKRFFIQAAG
ncbi:2-polyprenyl-6-methoxyphenol hydroxylase (plasmid) [Legionella adelaidensis]|uniref:2-polyprenyl-6-methoxyphenol hydroxylase n=1 Tax=Legionella adelaidensis TaxID=45056 RepID=A0A0W0R128_9GAMM|nr:FAD-dependent monooxygenase [Legionella adelaidensis]KTC64775.1 2-polyprenyl-6-methoxyphenol hydroxylase [Legionella adelaidensis]VEH81908.1 2-polyprenyl-6-methoxyphenol hydroxylase [Legionella adelaidensis]